MTRYVVIYIDAENSEFKVYMVMDHTLERALETFKMEMRGEYEQIYSIATAR
jgi:hypothetical protein